MARPRGQAVVLAYMTIVILTVLGNALLQQSLTASRHVERQQLQRDVFYLAEGGLEDATSQFAQAVVSAAIDPDVPRFPTDPNVMLTTNFSNGAVALSDVTEVQPPAVYTQNEPDGTAVFIKRYRVRTTVQHPTVPAVAMTVNQVLERRIIFTFQHAVFYDGDLEWQPGADMALSGRIHSNSDIYLGANTTLTVDTEHLYNAGQLFHRRKDGSTLGAGNVLIKKLGTTTYPALTFDSTSPTWFTDSQTTWAGTVKTGVHGVTQRAAPQVASIAPGGFYATNAAVRVVNGTITDAAGTPLTVPPGTIQTSTSFFNNREGKFVRMTEISLRRLAGWFDCTRPGGGAPDGILDPPITTSCNPYVNQLPANGLLYATRDDALLTEQPGIRVHDGGEIFRAGGLTIVSNDPVYVRGNFNTTSKKPVAVIADAVNLLSGAWDNDADSTVNNVTSGSPRTASNTTYNAAFIAGITTTVSGGQYNGGLENYPRLHERWTSRTLTIRGSFVSLWASQIATGAWNNGQQASNSQYTAPNRAWSYETDFADGVGLPPFTPATVQLSKGAWWKD